MISSSSPPHPAPSIQPMDGHPIPAERACDYKTLIPPVLAPLYQQHHLRELVDPPPLSYPPVPLSPSITELIALDYANVRSGVSRQHVGPMSAATIIDLYRQEQVGGGATPERAALAEEFCTGFVAWMDVAAAWLLYENEEAPQGLLTHAEGGAEYISRFLWSWHEIAAAAGLSRQHEAAADYLQAALLNFATWFDQHVHLFSGIFDIIEASELVTKD